MAKDYEDGVWRTVGGRRIFIKDGEDLSTAMKKSGKFKSKKALGKGLKDLDKEELDENVKKNLFGDKSSEKDYSNTGLTDKEKTQVAESSKGALKELKTGEVKRQKEDIEKASGLKVEKSFETDLYGNGKEDRFELSDGRIVSHTTEAMGSKVDKWSISKVENGSMNSKTFDSYDQMINHLSRGEQGYGTSYKKYFDEHPKASFEDFERDYMKKIKSSK